MKNLKKSFYKFCGSEKLGWILTAGAAVTAIISTIIIVVFISTKVFRPF
jgi:hypothetical protein